MNGKTYYCVWGNSDQILCLTTDYGIAMGAYTQHMTESGYVTDDSPFFSSVARIEEFDEFPVTLFNMM